MSIHSPLVSCVMPTANRRRFVPQAIRYFLRQDYLNKELVILDDGAESVADLIPDDTQIRYIRLTGNRTLGKKRNEAVEASRGDLIMHWDDDDWHSSQRIQLQMNALLAANAEVCSVTQMLYYELATGNTWLYNYTGKQRPWLAGGTLLYTRDFWRRSPFPDIQVASDTRFIFSQRLNRSVVMPDYQFYVAMIHPTNTSHKNPKGAYWSRWQGDLRGVMGDDLRFYETGLSREQTFIVKDDLPVKPPTYAILMVTHNALEIVRISTLRALRHIANQDARLVVVDNASTDGTEQWLANLAARGDIDLIRSGGNIGHGPALELARTRTTAPILVTLDSDAFPLSDDWLSNLHSRLTDSVKAAGILHHRDYIHPSCMMVARATLDQYGLMFLNEKGQPSNFDVAERISYDLKRHGFKIAGLQRTNAMRRGSISEPVYLGSTYEEIVYHQWYSTRAEISSGQVDDVPPNAMSQSKHDLLDADAHQPREITVVIGVHITNDQPLRWRNLLTCLQALNQQDIARWRYQIVVVEQDKQPQHQAKLSALVDRYMFAYNPGAYNRGWAFNVGAMLPSASNGVLCLLDADLLIPPDFLRTGLEALQTHHAVRPYTYVRYLEASASEQILRDFADNPKSSLIPQNYRGRSFDTSEGGCIWIESALYREIGGHDERFRGWGREDREFSRRLTKATNITVLPLTLLHLYHEPSPTDDRWAQANQRLLDQIERDQAPTPSRQLGDLNLYSAETSSVTTTKPKRDWENWFTWEAERIDRIVANEPKTGKASPRQQLAHMLMNLGSTLLDVGCGPGALWTHLQPSTGFHWVGADVTLAMLRGAERQFPSVPLYNADSGALPFADNSFDIVLMRHLLEHLPQWLMETTLHEAMRVARQAVVVDFYNPPLTSGTRRINRVAQNFLDIQWHKNDIEQPIGRIGGRVELRFTLSDQHTQTDEVWLVRPSQAEPRPQTSKISIIMPTYKRAHTIYRTINTILAQTYQNWELIVVDNAVDTQYHFDDQRIHVYSYTQQSSAAYARNHGLEHATGDVVCFFDDDDDMYPDYLSSFITAFEVHPLAKLIRCGMDVSEGKVNYTFATPECCIRRQYATPTWTASGPSQDQRYFKSLIEKNDWSEAKGDIVSLRNVLCRANSDAHGGLRSGRY